MSGAEVSRWLLEAAKEEKRLAKIELAENRRIAAEIRVEYLPLQAASPSCPPRLQIPVTIIRSDCHTEDPKRPDWLPVVPPTTQASRGLHDDERPQEVNQSYT